jgi:hypothetical protein
MKKNKKLVSLFCIYIYNNLKISFEYKIKIQVLYITRLLYFLSYIIFFYLFSAPMKWTELHDQLFVREILLMQPWTSGKASPERGETWLGIATSLNSLQSPIFRVTQRSVCDRYALLENKYKKKLREETLASGISCEENEVELGMDEIVSLFYEADIEHERVAAEKKKKLEEESNQAAKMRHQSLE